jgi:hypothetical protein
MTRLDVGGRRRRKERRHAEEEDEGEREEERERMKMKRPTWRGCERYICTDRDVNLFITSGWRGLCTPTTGDLRTICRVKSEGE